MPDRIDIPWEWEEPDDPDVLGAWVARYPGHGAYWFVGFARQLTFEPEDKDADWLTWHEVRGNMPGAAAPLVRNHLADGALSTGGGVMDPYEHARCRVCHRPIRRLWGDGPWIHVDVHEAAPEES